MNGMQKLFLIRVAWLLIGLAIAAFAIWLAIRVINRRERWAKRVAIVLVIAGLSDQLGAYDNAVGVLWRTTVMGRRLDVRCILSSSDGHVGNTRTGNISEPLVLGSVSIGRPSIER